MKVIFLEDVAGTADAGEVKEVKNGFARNFLLPKKLAAPATPDQMQRIKAIEKAAEIVSAKNSGVVRVIAIEGMIPVSFVIAAFITPSIDPVTQAAVAIPLMVLYALGIGLVKLVETRALGKMPNEDEPRPELDN